MLAAAQSPNLLCLEKSVAVEPGGPSRLKVCAVEKAGDAGRGRTPLSLPVSENLWFPNFLWPKGPTDP